MGKHTPGPWKHAEYILYDGNGQVWYAVHAAKRGQIIRCKRQEDAKAVQAFPDLLEAVQMVRNYVVTMKGIGHEYQISIDAAIKKATQ